MYVSWTTHKVEVAATKVKEVVCESCKTHYAYLMTRKEVGQGTTLYEMDHAGAQQRAAAHAHSNLQNAFENALELVPCPKCGTYQSNMVQFLRNTHLKWLYIIVALLILGGVAALFQWIFSSEIAYVGAAAVCIAVAVGLVAYRRAAAATFNPNEGDPSARIKLGQSMALTRVPNGGHEK